MHSDSAILTGTGHSRVAECAQDYAIHRDVNGFSWGIVSDGCSSAGRTDIGARLLAMAVDSNFCDSFGKSTPPGAYGILTEMLLGEKAMNWVRAISPALPAGASEMDLQATLVAAIGKDEWAVGLIAGDGALIAVKNDASCEVIEHRFSANLPAYPVYLTSARSIANFIDQSQSMGQRLEVHRTCFDAAGVQTSTQMEVIPIDDTLLYAVRTYGFQVENGVDAEKGLKVLLAVSDGLFSRPRTELGLTVAELTGFKSLNGSFLRRRVGSLGDKWAKSAAMPRDDFSVAGICWPAEAKITNEAGGTNEPTAKEST